VDDVLAGLYLLRGATADDLAAVRAIARPRALAPRAALFAEDEAPAAMYLVRTGKIEVAKGDAAIATIAAGDVIGELAFFDGAKRSAGARALEQAEVVELPYAALRDLMAQRPSLALVVYRNACDTMAARLRQTSSDLAWLNAYARS
jgi:CRP-like cAMP-binding protein